MSGINGTGGVKVGELLRECMKALEAAGNDNPRFETEQLVMKFCGVKRSDILMFPGLLSRRRKYAAPYSEGIPESRCNISWASGSSTDCRFTSAREFSFRGRILKRSWRLRRGSCGNARESPEQPTCAQEAGASA